MSNDTFNEAFLQSIEGQLQFDLATKLKFAKNINGIDYQRPKFKNTVAIMDFHQAEHPAGQFNSNLQAEVIKFVLK